MKIVPKGLSSDDLTDVMSKWNAVFDPSKTPPLLYHYTDFGGLHGILSEDLLRATSSDALNDGTELDFGRSVIAKHVKSKNSSKSSAALIVPPDSVFVTCFCEQPDLLSMWRSYAGQGGGYCLCFDWRILKNSLQADNLTVGSKASRLVKIHYGDKLPSAVKSVLECDERFNGAWLFERMIKHEGFREEKEWRFIVFDPPADKMSFYSGQASIKAFVKVKLMGGGKLPLKKVIYGPTLRNDTAPEKTLKWMLEKYGYPDVAVEKCQIPYRMP